MRAGTKHSSPAAQGVVRIPSVRCVLGVCALAAARNSGRDVILKPVPRSKEAPERGFVLMWRRNGAVDRAVAALNRTVGALNRRLPPYRGPIAI